MTYLSFQILPGHMKYYNTWTDNDDVSAPPLHSSAEGTMEAIGHVDGHVGSSQLFKCLGIQNQEERPFILQKRKISSSLDEFVLSSAKAGESLNCLSFNSLLLDYRDHTAVVWSNFITHYSLSDFFPVPTVPFPFYLAFSCDTFLWHLLSRRHINKAVPSLMFRRETNTAD